MIFNSKNAFGLVTIVLHWLLALIIIGQFILGLYMLSLSYYDPSYHSLPFYHKSIGIIFAFLLFIRIGWGSINLHPQPASNPPKWQSRLAVLLQWAMNLLLIAVVIMGYLISTATGDGISVFGWFEIPASMTSIPNQEEVAGKWHYWLACTVIALAGFHSLAALKHHFVDKDQTLNRMIRISLAKK